MARRGAIGLGLGLVVLAGCAAGSATVARSSASAPSGSTASAGSTAQASWTPWPAGSVAVIPIPTALPSEITYDQAIRLFQYDRSRPFDIRETAADAVDGATVHDITYVGAAGTRYQANLVLPAGRGPFGGVMYLHGAGGSSSDFLSEATALAGRGVASLLITQPEAQQLPGDGNAAVTEIVYEMREMSRAMDLLASRPEVDPSRLGFVGFSFGAVRGATFAGFQGGRLKIAVLASTPPSYDTPAMASFDPIAWVSHVSPAALYIQEGKLDTWFTHDEAEALIGAAREPKRLVWYDANHGLDGSAYDDRLAWLGDALGI
jgi:dienelactone hydrolase